jgi:hypothetical protein
MANKDTKTYLSAAVIKPVTVTLTNTNPNTGNLGTKIFATVTGYNGPDSDVVAIYDIYDELGSQTNRTIIEIKGHVDYIFDYIDTNIFIDAGDTPFYKLPTPGPTTAIITNDAHVECGKKITVLINNNSRLYDIEFRSGCVLSGGGSGDYYKPILLRYFANTEPLYLQSDNLFITPVSDTTYKSINIITFFSTGKQWITHVNTTL